MPYIIIVYVHVYTRVHTCTSIVQYIYRKHVPLFVFYLQFCDVMGDYLWSVIKVIPVQPTVSLSPTVSPPVHHISLIITACGRQPDKKTKN